MNALYCSCIIDPFLYVAKRLKEEQDITPVYWVGDIESSGYKDPAAQEVKAAFPGIDFQPFHRAWHGNFPERVEKKAVTTYVDIDFLKQFSYEELQALSMMDRLDYDRQSFCLMERERYYLTLAKKWLACIDLFGVDVVVSATSPHRVFDYVLYLVCRYKGIKFISFYTMLPGRIYPLLNFSEQDAVSRWLGDDYEKRLKSNLSIDMLPDDIRSSYLKLQGDYKTAIPSYMVKHVRNNKKSAKMGYLFRRFLGTHKWFGENSIFSNGGHNLTIYKNKKYSIEDTVFSVWDWYRLHRAKLKYDKKMHALYMQMASEVSFDVPYVAFFLQYQPEATTAPNGDIFANQTLCIESLLRNLPNEVFIYVKEHPNQYGSHVQGNTKRIKEFYYDLVKNPRVRLIPFDVDSFSLMENSLAVSTVTGTVGWEAVVRKKPVIIFGRVWYECAKGVLKVVDDASASKMYSFIREYRYDENAILAYLQTIEAHTFRAYHYSGYKKATGISLEESLNNIYSALVTLIKEGQ